ncbi:MAG: hypothetical protein AAF740_13320, partial [Bacteroidota bacterium]
VNHIFDLAIPKAQMKKVALFLLFCSTILSSYAQKEENGRMLSVSYFTPFVTQPGIKVSTAFRLKEVKDNQLSIRPHFTWFMQSELHQNFILGGDISYTIRKPEKYFYLAPSVGVGYLLSIENTEGSVNLGSGDIEQERETLHYFLPTLNFELGKLPKKRLGYFFRAFWGRKMTGQEVNSAFFGAELGIIYAFKKK